MKKFIFIVLAVIVLVSCGEEKNEPAMHYTVTFETDGGTPVPSAQNVEAGGKASAPSTNPSKTGYVFLYWQLTGATTPYNFQTAVNSNIALTAKWQVEAKVEYWQVTWELNGGTCPAGDNHAMQVAKGGTLPEPAQPTKAGSTFDGWFKESALTNKIVFPYDVSSMTGDFTLYAKWEIEGGDTLDPTGYQMFTTIAALKTWLANQPGNTIEMVFKVGLKNVNLDKGDNWTDLGLAVNGTKYVDLNLQGCTGANIPDGRIESKWEGSKLVVTTYGAFVGCNNLVSINLPENLNIIGKYVFRYCEGLRSVVLPKGITNIKSCAFDGCRELNSIELPDGLQALGDLAFQNTGLGLIIIPGSVKELETKAFSSCSSLQSIELKEGVEVIGEMAFSSCNKLESITLPSSLKTIGNDAFASYQNHSLKTIAIPASVTSIGNNAFALQALEDVIMLPATPPLLGVYVFSTSTTSGNPIPLKIKVPAASLNAYKTASRWKDYADKIEANSN